MRRSYTICTCFAILFTTCITGCEPKRLTSKSNSSGLINSTELINPLQTNRTSPAIIAADYALRNSTLISGFIQESPVGMSLVGEAKDELSKSVNSTTDTVPLPATSSSKEVKKHNVTEKVTENPVEA